MGDIKRFSLLGLAFAISIFSFSFISSTTYITDVYFTVPSSVYTANETISLRGFAYQANYSNSGTLLNASSALANATVNLSIMYSNRTLYRTYNLTTDSNGSFYSKNNFRSSALEVNAPLVAGTYILQANHTDLNSNVSSPEVGVIVINAIADFLRVSTEKAKYVSGDTIKINAEAVKNIGDREIYVSNFSVSGSFRNASTKEAISGKTFNCTTGSNGKCTANLSSPSVGEYFVEIEDFKSFSSFSVVPFSFNLYMKDELGKSLKNVFTSSEQVSVEVRINNVSSGTYTFSGYIQDSSGNNVKAITSKTLNSTNSFTNKFTFSLSGFSQGSYTTYITILNSANSDSTESITSFKVEDWTLSLNKKTTGSGFEYEYSTFANKTLKLESFPKYRANGSVINNTGNFSIYLKDELDNSILAITNVSWNSSCEDDGCYEINFTSPNNAGEYFLDVNYTLSGVSRVVIQRINVVTSVMSAQSVNRDGDIKELFGTNEYIFISLSGYNSTSSSINFSDVDIFSVTYMNGTEFPYNEASNFEAVNLSNYSDLKWAWNSTLQRLKLNVPKFGGLYDVYLFADNQTVGANTRFTVNPYDTCMVPKNSRDSNYYAWQFKTTDTAYFDILVTQANNPSGRATAENGSNSSGGSYYGIGTGCTADTTKQALTNATITVMEVKNAESGVIQNLNTTASVCGASGNTSGGYVCEVKPLTKWSGGTNVVKFKITAQDGTEDIAYSRFESRAFYLYGWSSSWQNNPSSNITLNFNIYEAGNSWWYSGSGGGGVNGTVTLQKIEYQGSDGDWIWPPIDYNYSVSEVPSVSVSSTTSYSNGGQMNLNVSNALGGVWKTGYYRAIFYANTTSGDSDYGYAWFGIKLWETYGQSVDCTNATCNYKSYSNTRENITLYVSINKAGQNWWNWGSSGQNLESNVTVSVKKISNCKTWPCKELNSSQYTSSSITVNQSSPYYGNANLSAATPYLIQINSTQGRWDPGWYQIALNVAGDNNKTDTGSGWFNAIAFYIETQSVNANGSSYIYTIKTGDTAYFNISTTKNYKWYTGSSRYVESDYINATVVSVVLRTWDQNTYQSREYNSTNNLTVAPLNFSGIGILNVSFYNGTTNTNWPAGWYWGELTMNNSDGEKSTGWLWFEAKPFRVQLSNYNYTIGISQCMNATLGIYEPEWSNNQLAGGNYSVLSIYEDIWNGLSYNRVTYNSSNTSSFNTQQNVSICPQNNDWGTGSWGGYHYLNIIVTNNSQENQTGWLSFRSVPFIVSWSSAIISSLSSPARVRATVTTPAGSSTSGNLTKLYQWRYDNNQNTKEEYIFSIGNSSVGFCYSNVSSSGCTISGAQNVTIFPSSGGWRNGYNYVYGEWTKNDSTTKVEDWNGIYFNI